MNIRGDGVRTFGNPFAEAIGAFVFTGGGPTAIIRHYDHPRNGKNRRDSSVRGTENESDSLKGQNSERQLTERYTVRADADYRIDFANRREDRTLPGNALLEGIEVDLQQGDYLAIEITEQ